MINNKSKQPKVKLERSSYLFFSYLKSCCWVTCRALAFLDSRTLELINYARVARVRVVRVFLLAYGVAYRKLELINYARVARVRVVRVVRVRLLALLKIRSDQIKIR
jgi:hypothetical protein